MVFAVPPGFVAHVSAQPQDLTFGQFSSFTVASRLSLHGPERSFGQQLQGDLRQCTGRGSHCPPIAWPARSGYSSLSRHLRDRVYFRVGDDCNRAVNLLASSLTGAMGICFPMTTRREDAEAAARAVRYPPEAKRFWCPFYAPLRWNVPCATILNARTTRFLQLVR
jgi:hypothetical protein